MFCLLDADTLLNVFLAIAVDNLASAQELTAAEEERKLEEEVRASCFPQHKLLLLLTAATIRVLRCREFAFDVVSAAPDGRSGGAADGPAGGRRRESAALRDDRVRRDVRRESRARRQVPRLRLHLRAGPQRVRMRAGCCWRHDHRCRREP